MKNPFKEFLPRSLLGRTLLILVTPLLLVQIITTWIFFDNHWQKMANRLSYSVAGEVALLAAEVEADGELRHVGPNAAKTLELASAYKSGEKLAKIYDRKSADDLSRESLIGDSLARALQRQLGRPFDINVDRDRKWVEVRVQLPEGVLIVATPERRLFSSSGYVVLLWMVMSSLILLTIAIFFMRGQIRPIRRLAIAAERFGKGRDVPFFKVEGAREVRQAARAFIDMKDRLRRQIQQRTAMLAGVSHVLRTPLTRMKLQLEMMGDNPDVKDLKADVGDMERMIEAYLQFARGEGGEEPVRTELNDLILRVVMAANRDEDSSVHFTPQGSPTVMLRPVAFERCLTNLVGNALKYGSEAWISVRRIEDMIEITIDDDGPGIPKEHYEDVFKPFFRGEASRNSKTGGIGLGLPIAQDIVLAHGGQIWLDRSPRGGLRVLIDLPV